MTQRKWFMLIVPLFAAFAAGTLGYTILGNYGQADTSAFIGKGKAAEPLPIRQVVLFNSGVGYFQREGEVDGDARIQLSFPVGDINDLLKSLVLQDATGHVGTVNYDSSDPIDKILRSFALDLTSNPTFAQILNQARGEKVEISRAEKKEGQPIKLAGTVIGIEVHRRSVAKEQVIDVEILNLNTPAGIQSIPMEQVVSVRFQNAVLESEFQRALNVLATSHDVQKKSVSVGFHGQGKRNVRVGYVVERPIWKTSYRLRMDPAGKVFLQGWALVENTSDDDWNDVRMVLVSGKPISFRMNLYDPIYIPRPFVEPEMFASLRPPVYSGAMADMDAKAAGGGMPGQGLGGFGMAGVNGPIPAPGVPNFQINGQLQNRDNLLREKKGQEMGQNRNEQQAQNNKLSYEELMQRRVQALSQKADAKKAGSVIAGFNFKEGIQSVATADEIGDYYQYSIDQKINLPRQKSAMLPILDQTIAGQKISIYNESIHTKYPLLGLKLKNTSGQPLTQGPITVYDAGVFAGDTRILDLQPNEERLLSYALDQGTEVKTDVKQAPSPDLTFRIGGDSLSATYYLRQTKTYTIKNRSTHDRLVVLEHPIRPAWKLTEPTKPIEQTRDLYRFQVPVPSGKTVAFHVVEDEPRFDSFALRGGQPSYGVANGINIRVETHVDQHKLIGLKVVKGFLEPTYKVRETKAYFVQNLSDQDRTFTVDHVVRPGWARLDDKGEPQTGPQVFRFKLAIAKGKTGQEAVREERNLKEGGSLLSKLSETALREYLAHSVPSAEVKAALTRFLAMQAKIAETSKELAGVEKQLDTLNKDQARVRENLKIIPPSSEHYKTFLEKFVAQEKQIETYQATIRQLTTTLQSLERERDQYVSKLDAE